MRNKFINFLCIMLILFHSIYFIIFLWCKPLFYQIWVFCTNFIASESNSWIYCVKIIFKIHSSDLSIFFIIHKILILNSDILKIILILQHDTLIFISISYSLCLLILIKFCQFSLYLFIPINYYVLKYIYIYVIYI